MKRTIRGFTLAELLIVVAIIAVLVAIAIPVFGGQVEKSREVTDLSSVRSAATAVMNAAITDDGSAEYAGQRIKQSDGSFRAVVSPLKQKNDGWTTDVGGLQICGVDSSLWTGNPRRAGVCAVTYIPNSEKVLIQWSSGYTTMSLQDLKNVDNDDRVKEDQNTLRRLGDQILSQGWTVSELKGALGLPETSGNAVRIADYYQLKTGSYGEGQEYSSDGFKITSKEGGKLNQLLSDTGYLTGTSTQSRNPSGQGRVDTTNQYSLFYSDELAANKFKNYDINATKRSIIIDKIKTDSTGRIKSFTIYTKAMDNQANLDAEEKAKFSIDIG